MDNLSLHPCPWPTSKQDKQVTKQINTDKQINKRQTNKHILQLNTNNTYRSNNIYIYIYIYTHMYIYTCYIHIYKSVPLARRERTNVESSGMWCLRMWGLYYYYYYFYYYYYYY